MTKNTQIELILIKLEIRYIKIRLHLNTKWKKIFNSFKDPGKRYFHMENNKSK